MFATSSQLKFGVTVACPRQGSTANAFRAIPIPRRESFVAGANTSEGEISLRVMFLLLAAFLVIFPPTNDWLIVHLFLLGGVCALHTCGSGYESLRCAGTLHSFVFLLCARFFYFQFCPSILCAQIPPFHPHDKMSKLSTTRSTNSSSTHKRNATKKPRSQNFTLSHSRH